MRARRAASVAVLFIAALTVAAQGKAAPGAPRLAFSRSAPVVDGTVAAGEYSFTRDSGDFVLSVNRTSDTLSLAVTGMTEGWIGVGVGAMEMNGATIFMGYVDEAGAVSFKPQAGRPEHTHVDTSAEVLGTVRSYALKESGGATTLEIALRADRYLAAGQAELEIVFAIGPDDSFTEYHLDRDLVSLALDAP